MLRVQSFLARRRSLKGLSFKKFRLYETKLFFCNVEYLRCFKSGFSIAEAMIMLLVVSVAMALSAPIISKQMKNSLPAQANSGVCWPDYASGVDVSYNGTATEDGWISWWDWNGDRWDAILFIQDVIVMRRGAYKYGDHMQVMVPIKSGDVYRTNVSSGTLTFYPCRR